jgi:hypothetical protein
MIAEIKSLKEVDDLALWAHRRLPAKNTLTIKDADAVEDAFRTLLDASGRDVLDNVSEPGKDLLQSAPPGGCH